jgi:hypothetical protein
MTATTRSAAVGASAKGAAVRGTLRFVEQLVGPEALERVLDALPAERAAALRAVQPTDDVPYAHLVSLWGCVDAELRGTYPDWAESAGAFSIESLGLQLYGGILRKPTPSDFLTQSVSLFRLFYAPGDMAVVQEDPGGAVLRLVGFDPMHAVFCRRQVGGLRRALELAGGLSPVVRHVRCSLQGDVFCEWEMHWAEKEARSGT